jgi:uncharacterized membrane protein
MLGYDWPRLHALLNDLPVALLVTAVLFDLIALATRRPSFRQVGFWTMLAGAIGGVLAVLSGLQAEEHIAHGDAVHRVMETHERLGLISLGVFGVLMLWRIVRERRMAAAERALSVVFSLGGVCVLVATGLYGGRLVFEHAAGIPTPVLQAEMEERSREHHHDGMAADGDDHDRVNGPGAVVAPDSTPAQRTPEDHAHPPGTKPHTH